MGARQFVSSAPTPPPVTRHPAARKPPARAHTRARHARGAGKGVAPNQLIYNLTRRGIEWDLLPWLRARSIPVMAYSPLEQARIVGNKGLAAFAATHGMTPAQAALAWLLAQDDVIAIPKCGNAARMAENVRAASIELTRSQLAELDAVFPPPERAQPLEML